MQVPGPYPGESANVVLSGAQACVYINQTLDLWTALGGTLF